MAIEIKEHLASTAGEALGGSNGEAGIWNMQMSVGKGEEEKAWGKKIPENSMRKVPEVSQ